MVPFLSAELRKILSAYADEYEHIYICPDGELYNVSFERHIEGYEISYLSSPKGLLREDVGKQEGEIVSFVSPDFDSMSEEEDGQRGRKVGKLYGSYIEGVCIKETLGDRCQLFSRKEASSRNFLSVRNPKVLHVSTHGQYDHDEGVQLMNRGRLLFSAYNTENGEKGYVTAQDIKDMELKETDLVVLSACNTGIGETLPGEGIYGIRRAFELAGAKTLLLTLEEIDDYNTAIFMNVFYRIYSRTREIYRSFRETREYLGSTENALKELKELKKRYEREMPQMMHEAVYRRNNEELERRIEKVRKEKRMVKRTGRGYVEEDWKGIIIQGNVHI